MTVINGGIFESPINRNPNGRVFHVDPSVSGSLQAAIDECTADNGDIIVVSPGTHSVTETVAFDKRGITVIAAKVGMAERGERFTVAAAASFDDGPAATITAPCHIIGLGFAGRDTTQESLLIDCEEAGGWSGGAIILDECRFSVWYGAMDAGVRCIGGAQNVIKSCTFDGLFGGFGTAAIVLENDTGGLAAAYLRVEDCLFQGVGSGKHAIKHATGSIPASVLYKDNVLLPGWSAQGKFLDNNSVASTGMAANNWLAPLANQAAAFENLTNSTIGFAGNHYEE